MTPDEYFFPHAQRQANDALNLFLSDFQQEFKESWQHVNALVEDDDRVMFEIRDYATYPPMSAVEEQALEEWFNRSRAFHFGLQWIREHEAAVQFILGVEATSIDFQSEPVAPLWNEFLRRKQRDAEFDIHTIQDLIEGTFFAAEKEHESM